MIFHRSISCGKTFPWIPLFFTLWPRPYCLTYFWKLNLIDNFSTVSARVNVFHMSIPSDKIFLLVLNLLTFTFVQFKKKNDIVHKFQIINIRNLKLQRSISCVKIFLLVSRDLSFWHWPSLELACPFDIGHPWNWPL